MFRRNTQNDLLNEAHTLGLGALTLFEDIAGDLEVAAQLADEHHRQTRDAIDVLMEDAGNAADASNKYRAAAERVRGLVSA